MRLVLCCDPTDPRHVEPAFEREWRAARQLGLEIDLVDHDALVRGHSPSWRTIPDESAVYRGWMMTPVQYASMHAAALSSGRVLVNSPEQFEHCHYFPRSYDVIREHTPRSVWSESVEVPPLSMFGSHAVVLKDFVKSEKHSWLDACFIPDASDRVNVERVVRNFIALRGAELNGGLVFREFVELERVGVHPKSGMPLSRELRQFFFDGKPLLRFNYWDDVDYEFGDALPSWVSDVAARVRSRFFSMDLARTAAGEWLIVEVGDGQVTGLPDAVEPSALLQRLMAFAR
jgi:hypothetical protein